jgi:Uma2 family endonuclease
MPESTKDISIAKFLPATLIPDTALSDDRLERFASDSLDADHIRCERNRNGTLRIYPPAPEVTRLMVNKVYTDLLHWLARAGWHGQPMIRRRFFLEDGVMMCPDIAYVASRSRKKRPDMYSASILRLCPNFVVEVCSHPRELRHLKDKMLRWIANGIELGWLMVPQEQCVFIYSPGAEPEIVDGDFVAGNGPADGLLIVLDDIWRLDVFRRFY